MTDEKRCTLVFDYNLRKHDGNPFHTDTPFGRPAVMSLGDVCAEADGLRDRCEALESSLREMIPLAESASFIWTTQEQLRAWQENWAAAISRAKELIGGDDG